MPSVCRPEEFLQRQMRPETDSEGIELFLLWAQKQRGLACYKGQEGGSVASPSRMAKDPGAETRRCHWSGVGPQACTGRIWLTLLSNSLAVFSAATETRATLAS